MAGELKLAIVLTATMRGAEAFGKAQTGMKGMQAAMGQLTAAIKLFAAWAAFDFLKDSFSTFIEFEQTVAEAGSIVGATREEIQGFASDLRDMSQAVPKSANDLGLALYDIFSAGITDSADAMDTLELSAQAATAGLTETATAAKAGISTMNAFGMEADDLTHIFDVQFLTIKFGILRYEELSNVIGQMAPAAKQAGQSMESMFASLALLTKKGLDARKAAVALARAYESLTRPEAIEAARELGVSFVELTPKAQRLWQELQRNKQMSDDMANSLKMTEAQIKSFGDAMREVSLEQQKNTLETMKIRQEADDQGRKLTSEEMKRIEELEEANDRLAITNQELSISQTEAQIQAESLTDSIVAQKEATDGARTAFEQEVAMTGQFRPLVDIVKDLGANMADLDEVAKAEIIAKLFPQVRARRAILSIMGSEEELIKITKEMEEEAGAMGEAYAINADTTANSMKLMENAMDDVKIELATVLLPILEEFLVLFKEEIVPILKDVFIPTMQLLVPVIKGLLIFFKPLLELLGEYPIIMKSIIVLLTLWKVAQLALNVAMAANPLGLIIVAVFLLITAIVFLIKHWDEVVKALEPVKNAFVSLGRIIMRVLQPVIDAIKFIIDNLKKIGGGISGAGKKIGGFLGFDEGGIATRPTIAMIAETKPEAVVPLKGGSIPVQILGGGGGGGNITEGSQDTFHITLNFPGITQASQMEPAADRLMKEFRKKKSRGE
jgi:TP901 family phage tail tape measure protein